MTTGASSASDGHVCDAEHHHHVETNHAPAQDRRSFLRCLCCLAAGAAGGVLIPGEAALAARRPTVPTASRRVLALHHLHTDERVRVTYWANGRYDRAALGRLNQVLRDWRTGRVVRQDPRLFDLLYDLHRLMDTSQPFDVVCGYRSPQTNARLAAETSGVAQQSLHMKGMAIDIALPGRDVGKLRKAALALGRGGVGYYPDRFVHVDVGPVRWW